MVQRKTPGCLACKFAPDKNELGVKNFAKLMLFGGGWVISLAVTPVKRPRSSPDSPLQQICNAPRTGNEIQERSSLGFEITRNLSLALIRHQST